MSDSGGFVGDWIVAVIALILILIPGYLEVDFVKELYRSNPVLFELGVGAVVAGVGVALWLRHAHREG